MAHQKGILLRVLVAKILLLLLLSSNQGYSQGVDLDKVIKEISFSDDTLQSVYYWIADNISYDVALMSASKQYTSEDEILEEVIARRSGVCQHYADLFSAILRKLNYESFVVGGYTRLQGKIDTKMSHAWNAVKLDDGWYFFDPTWSSGYLKDEKFVKNYDEVWYKVAPTEFIQTHIPFDPMWQLLPSPVNNTEIEQNQFEVSSAELFQFEDSIQAYQQQDILTQKRSSLDRIFWAGVTNQLVQKQIDVLQQQIAIFEHNKQVEQMNAGVALLNALVDDYNIYIAAKNKRFRNPKWPDHKLRALADSLRTKVDIAQQILVTTVADEEGFAELLKQNKKSTEEISTSIDRETAFIERYLKTWKPLRMFTFY